MKGSIFDMKMPVHYIGGRWKCFTQLKHQEYMFSGNRKSSVRFEINNIDFVSPLHLIFGEYEDKNTWATN